MYDEHYSQGDFSQIIEELFKTNADWIDYWKRHTDQFAKSSIISQTSNLRNGAYVSPNAKGDAIRVIRLRARQLTGWQPYV